MVVPSCQSSALGVDSGVMLSDSPTDPFTADWRIPWQRVQGRAAIAVTRNVPPWKDRIADRRYVGASTSANMRPALALDETTSTESDRPIGPYSNRRAFERRTS